MYIATFDEDSRIIRVKLVNSVTGGALTGLTSASTGLKISTIASSEAKPTVYTVAGNTIESIVTLGTYAAPLATKCRFGEVDAVNLPGVYEIQLSNERFAVAGATSLIVSILGATNLMQSDLVVTLTKFDLQAAAVTALDIDTQLSSTHGSGSWTGGATNAPTVEEIDAELSSSHGTGLWSLNGTGAIEWTYTVTDAITHLPLSDVAVKVTSDLAGLIIVASAETDASGVALFYLNAGTYYMWCYKVGYNFTNPDTEVVL